MAFEFKPKSIFPPEKGRVLISEPLLDDPYFRRAVILLCEHNEQGSFGLILNKTLELKPHELIEDFPEFNHPLISGGPVDNRNLFFLHSLPNLDGAIEILPGLFLGGDFDELKRLIQIGILTPDNLRLFLGYSGWAENQLNQEMKDLSWLVAPTSFELIFDAPESDMWANHIKQLGPDYDHLIHFPPDPSMN